METTVGLTHFHKRSQINGQSSEWANVNVGVPQGSVFEPMPLFPCSLKTKTKMDILNRALSPVTSLYFKTIFNIRF